MRTKIRSNSRRIKNAPKEAEFVTPYNDLSKYNYTRTWEQERTVNVYGYDVFIPDMPPKEEIINYGRPLAEQIFRKTEIPKDLYYWNREEQEQFIEREHHRRKHGLWFYIKGEPTYIPGLFYFFLNYWPVETGKTTKYRHGDWKFFIIWMHVVLSEHIHGLIVFKCRRIGDTEKALCMLYEYGSRVRNTINQMYDCRVESHIKKTFNRFKKSHRKIIWYMQPVVKNEDPSETLEFMIPISKKDKMEEYVDEDGNRVVTEYEFAELASEVGYYTNTSGADGKRVGRIYVDEFGKFKSIDPEELWDLAKKALDDEDEGIIGKGLFTSTIEELEGGKSYDMAKKMWNQADPEILDEDGQTVSGLIRIVRGKLDSWKTDRWGKIDEDEVRESIKNKIEFYKNQKQWSKLTKYRRQNCIDIKDVFFNAFQGSNFNLENIQNRLFEIEYTLDNSTFVQGDLEWENGVSPKLGNPNNINKKCKVVWVPRENGRFFISQHPEDFQLRSNRMRGDSMLPRPYHDDKFACGIDPVSQQDVLASDDERSKSGLAIKRLLDMTVDSYDNFDDKGYPLDGGRNLKTNKYCCVYLYRHQDTADTYDDWLKALVYYGTDFLIEKQHASAFEQYLEARGFGQYYMENNNVNKNYRGQTEKFGVTANTKSIENYFSLINTYTNQFCNSVDIPLILEQWGSMVYGNQGKHDLGVATGFCEMAAVSKGIDTVNRETPEEQAKYDDFVEEHYY